MNNLIKVDGGNLWTTSVAIAEIFERPHRSVLGSIDSLLADGTINGQESLRVEYTDAKGEKRRAFKLNERAALVAMPFIGGRKSREGQRKLVDSFLTMRAELDRLSRFKGDPNWKAVRDESKTGFKVINQLLDEVRAEAGKETGPHVYMNEARLVNSIITGQFKGMDRDSIGAKTMGILIKIQAKDMRLIARGVPYADRRKELLKYAETIGMEEIGATKEKALIRAGKH
jgi:phage regulator Rha-like protein